MLSGNFPYADSPQAELTWLRGVLDIVPLTDFRKLKRPVSLSSLELAD
jgi:hypothetical protein